ncbi:MAG: hypothetical protein IJ167_02695 [Lachnospiraceae bacterium]|nr:hypothetical protein [Lachnospiraceae bacterium]
MLIMLALISGNEIVFKGAHDGLMLWFNSVIPLLLPFMLISALIVEKIQNLPKEKQKSYAILITLFTGIFCGYPLGAKNVSEFVKNKSYSKSTGEYLLPLCNNCSPMFLSGYIIFSVLNKKITFFSAIALIYIPYLIYILCVIAINKTKSYIGQNKSYSKSISNNDSLIGIKSNKEKKADTDSNKIVTSIIIQITFVGFYIIICSVISEYIMSIDVLSLINKVNFLHKIDLIQFNVEILVKAKTFLSGFTEITKGAMIIAQSSLFTEKHKTAIILSLTSFGGISAILQTKSVIDGLDISLKKYVIIKTICASATYGLSLAFM